MEQLAAKLDMAASPLRRLLGPVDPCCALILGSGLNPFAETLEDLRTLSYADVPFMGVSTADGHKGRFVLGRLPGTDRHILCLQGRLHGYEGFTASEVAFPVWLAAELGITTLITTNAAGAINPSFSVGDFCLMDDLINLTGRNPMAGRGDELIFERFVPMREAFDPKLRRLVTEVARQESVSLVHGIYLGLLGPSFETPAEIRAFASLGADTVAMSVVEEVIAARAAGMSVIGLSLVSNMACGVAGGDPKGEDINEVATHCIEPFARLIKGVVSGLDR